MMKLRSGLYALLFYILTVSCIDSTELSTIPEIRFEDLYFGRALNPYRPDSLVLTISFNDGDGDLGLSYDDINEPYHQDNFFIASNGKLIPLGQQIIAANLPPLISIPPGVDGTLAVRNTSRKGLYNNVMAAYLSDSSCLYYRIGTVMVRERDASILDETSEFYQATQLAGNAPFLVVKDTFYIDRNPNYSNIDVRFFNKPDAASEFREVNWRKQFCTDIFTGRFPVTTERKNAVSGRIDFVLNSTQLLQVMKSGIWRLEVSIKDRALNVSNTVRSREFTLTE